MACLRRVLRRSLERLAWPPPIASGAAAATSNGASGEDEHWHGFENADPQVTCITASSAWWIVTLLCCASQLMVGMQAVAELNGILAAFIALQRSVQRSSFEAVSARVSCLRQSHLAVVRFTFFLMLPMADHHRHVGCLRTM